MIPRQIFYKKDNKFYTHWQCLKSWNQQRDILTRSEIVCKHVDSLRHIIDTS